MKNYLQFGRIGWINAPLFLHWSVIAATLLLLVISLTNPIIALTYSVSNFGILFFHEIGHALVAKNRNVKVIAVKIGLVHGECVHEEPYYEWDEILICWGGVAAQLSVAIPIIIAAQVFSTWPSWLLKPADNCAGVFQSFDRRI
ncbi:MAG: hypothetical protein R2681_12955 [Pyrinomonadaceae bacterium]